MIKSRGFSAIELMMVLALVALLVVLGNYTAQSIERKLLATKVATQTLAYAKVTNRYIKNHYQEIYDQLSSDNGVKAITWEEIDQEEKVANLPATNIQGLKPCVYVMVSAKQVEPYLFFVRAGLGKVKLPNQVMGGDITTKIGGFGGMMRQDGMMLGLSNGWSFELQNLSDIVASCGGSNFVPNSPVVNLGMMEDLRIQLSPDKSLDRPKDPFAPPGSVVNNNTLQTDIANSHFDDADQNSKDNPHRFIFNNRSLVGLQAANSYHGPHPDDPITIRKDLLLVKVQGDAIQDRTQGSFAADTLQPLLKVEQGQTCDITQIGSIAQMLPSSDNPLSNLILGQAQCSHNPLFCQEGQDQTGQSPCWLPITPVSIRFNTSGSDVSCSKLAGAGFFILKSSLHITHGVDPGTPPWECHWEFHGRTSTTTDGGWERFIKSPDGRARALDEVYAVAYWESERDFVGSDCRTKTDWRPANITSVICTNDPAVVTYNL